VYLNLRIRHIFSGIAAGFLAVLLSGNVYASAKKKDSGKGEVVWQMPTHIQLAPIMLPLEGRRSAPATFFLKAKNKKFVVNICTFEPRIRDAVFGNLSRDPVRVKNRRMILTPLPKKLLKLVNKVVGNKRYGKRQIKQIFVYAGASQFKIGPDKRFPGGFVDGCQNVLRSEKERKAAEEAKKKN